MTSKMEQHSSPISDKRKRKLLFELERKESKKLKSFQRFLEQINQKPQYNQSRHSQNSASKESLPEP